MKRFIILLTLCAFSLLGYSQVVSVDSVTYKQVETINKQYKANNIDYDACYTVGLSMFVVGVVGTIGSVLTWQCNKNAIGRNEAETESCKKMSRDGMYATCFFVPLTVVSIPLTIVGAKRR